MVLRGCFVVVTMGIVREVKIIYKTSVIQFLPNSPNSKFNWEQGNKRAKN